MANPSPRPGLTSCTAQQPNGRFCDAESLPDAPFPICLKHAAKVLRYLNSYAPNGLEDRIILSARAMEQQRTEADRLPNRERGSGFVYYLRVGVNVKIGYSSDLAQRLRAYPPDSVLLAREPGTPSLELQRHREFDADLRLGKEWFTPSPRLLAHIARINEEHPLPRRKDARRPAREWMTDNVGQRVLR